MKKKKPGRKKQRPNKEMFEYQYIQIGLTAEDLAKYYNVKPQTIYNWARAFRQEEE